MSKTKLNPNAASYPMPVVLVGALVDGKPNYVAVGWFTQSNMNPPMLAVAFNKSRHTVEGMIKNGSFSVNIPSSKMTAETDYSGTKTLASDRGTKSDIPQTDASEWTKSRV